MKKTGTITKRVNLLAALTVCVLIVLSLFAFSFNEIAVKAENSVSDNWSEKLTVTNAQFSDYDGSAPYSPKNWTGASIGGANSSAVVAGVLDLDNYASSVEAYKLKQYGVESPDSPFGKTADKNQPGYYEGTNRKVLLINANGTPTAYGYTSDAFTLNAYSYYKISVWTKTGNIGANGGAAIILNLGDEAYGFTGIDTEKLDKTGDYADDWFKYTFYISTDAVASTSATLSLQLGYDDKINGVGGLNTEGYAKFDNIVATQLSAKSYFDATNSNSDDRTCIINANKATLLTGGDFASTDETAFGQLVGNNSAFASVIVKSTTNANSFGLENAITLPVERNDENAFIVSTYNADEEEFKSDYAGIKSKDFTIERYSYYQISAWYYSESVEGGDGVTAKLHYRHENATGEYAEVSATSLTMDGKANHNGWTRLVGFIKGSSIANYDAQLELALGSESNPSKGVVLFDEITIQRILPAVYSANSTDAKLNLDLTTIITDSTGVTNGSMNGVSEFKAYDEAPYQPSSWIKMSTSEADNDGYSKITVDMDDAVSGLVAVEDIPADVKNGAILMKDFGNALMLSSTTPTAYAYRSTSFTVAKDGYKKLTANLFVDELDGYGASLVLKKGNKVISSIEGIKSTGAYSFYIKSATADASLDIEIWLGQMDRTNNSSRLASGRFFVSEVALTDSTEEEFALKNTVYNAVRLNGNASDAKLATVDLTNALSLFDGYDQGALKTPFGWSLTKGASASVNYGIIDTVNDRGELIPASFDNDDKQYLFVLNNIVPTASEVALDGEFNLTADKYYTLTVNAKVNLPAETSEKAVGAFIRLSSADNLRFEFKDTTEKVDEIVYDNFRTFTFYIKAPNTDTTTSLFVGMGGDLLPNQHCAGWLYINDIALTEISAVDYDEACDGLKGDSVVINDYAIRADLTTKTEEEPEKPDDGAKPSSDIAWWLIPSILLAVAVVLAVVGSFIRKAIENRKPRRKANKTVARASYDRRNLIDKEEAEKKETANEEDTFVDFDDEAEETETAEEATEVEETETTEEATEAETAEETAEAEEATEDKPEDAE